MQDFKRDTEVVHHHGKQTEPQAVAHFLDELHDFNKLMSGKDSAVSQNLAHFNFKNLDTELHKSHNGKPAELDAHMHASAVFKIDGKMQLVFTDDLYDKNDKHNKSKDHIQHAYTIDEKTGKISDVFDIAHTKSGNKVLIHQKESGPHQKPTDSSTPEHTIIIHSKNSTEYDTPDGRKIKVESNQIAIQNPNGPAETFALDPSLGHIVHKVQNDKGAYEVQGGSYSSVTVSKDGSITADRSNHDFSTTTFPDGRRVERDGTSGATEGSGNIVRVKDGKGMETRLTWGTNPDNPDSVKVTDTATFLTNQSTEMQRVTTGVNADNVYKSYDEESNTTRYWKVNIDKASGKVDCRQVSEQEVDERRVTPRGYSNYEYEYE